MRDYDQSSTAEYWARRRARREAEILEDQAYARSLAGKKERVGRLSQVLAALGEGGSHTEDEQAEYLALKAEIAEIEAGIPQPGQPEPAPARVPDFGDEWTQAETSKRFREYSEFTKTFPTRIAIKAYFAERGYTEYTLMEAVKFHG